MSAIRKADNPQRQARAAADGGLRDAYLHGDT
jgi:hypothetical protein